MSAAYGAPTRRRPAPPTRALALLALACVLAVTTGCGGGDGGVVAPETCFEFAPGGNPAQGVVATRSVGSVCETLTLELVVKDITDLFGGSFTVTFDPAVVSYQGFSHAGSVLASDGAQVEALETRGAGRTTIGLVRLGSDTGVDVAGEGVLVRLTFVKATDSGNSDIGYENTRLIGSEEPPVAKPGIQWMGGSAVIQ